MSPIGEKKGRALAPGLSDHKQGMSIAVAKKKSTKKPTPIKAKSKYAPLKKAAAHCGVTIQTFTGYVDRYPDLPIVRRGSEKHPWEIDLKALDEWRDKTGKLKPTPAAGEGGSVNKKSQLQEALLEIEVQKLRGELLNRAEVTTHLRTKFAQFAKFLDLLPSMAGRAAGCTPEQIEILRDKFEEGRKALIRDDWGFFVAPDSV